LTFVIRPQFQKGLGLEEGAVGEKVFTYLRALGAECTRQEVFRQMDVETTGQVLWAVVHGVALLLIDFPDVRWGAQVQVIDMVIETRLEGLKAYSPCQGR